MTDLLTSADIDTLRRVWIQDLVDEHREFGSATIASGAAVGATTLALNNLGAGTIRRGVPFWVFFPGGSQERYYVAADATITAGAASVTISPGLLTAVSSSYTVRPDPYFKSIFNVRTRRQFFSDPELQDFATQATEAYGRRIATSSDPVRARYRAIRKLALEQMLGPGSMFIAELFADDDRNSADSVVKRLEKILEEDRTALESSRFGMSTVEVYR